MAGLLPDYSRYPLIFPIENIRRKLQYGADDPVGRAISFLTLLLLHQVFVQPSIIFTSKWSTASVTESIIRPSYYLLLFRNRRFFGHGTQLETVTQRLLVTKDCQRLPVVRSGDVGKIQLAIICDN